MMMQKILYMLFFVSSLAVAAHDTVLKLYRPYGSDAMEQAVPRVTSTRAGQCSSQSQLIVREDAWRCSAGGETYDPCFVKAGPNRTKALCPKSPWLGDSVQVRVNLPLNNEHNNTLDMSRTYPWAIELANGERCQAINTGQIYDQMPVRYRCDERNYLVGYLQRCNTVWSILEKTPMGVVTREITKAWF